MRYASILIVLLLITPTQARILHLGSHNRHVGNEPGSSSDVLFDTENGLFTLNSWVTDPSSDGNGSGNRVLTPFTLAVPEVVPGDHIVKTFFQPELFIRMNGEILTSSLNVHYWRDIFNEPRQRRHVHVSFNAERGFRLRQVFTVPEPSTALLLLLAIPVVLNWRAER